MDTTETVEPAGIFHGQIYSSKQFGDHILPLDQKIMSVSKFDFLHNSFEAYTPQNFKVILPPIRFLEKLPSKHNLNETKPLTKPRINPKQNGQVLQMLNTDHLAVGESVIEFGTCNERLLDHAKVSGVQFSARKNPMGLGFGYGEGRCFCVERLVRRCKVMYISE